VSIDLGPDAALDLSFASGVRPADAPAPSGESQPESEVEAPQPSATMGATARLAIAAAGALATAGAGFATAGVFRGVLPKVIAVAAALYGGGMVALSYRVKKPALVQYLTVPGALVIGALLVATDATGGSANVVSLIVEALTAGGIAEPPMPFDPGWRFLLFALIAILSAGASSLACGLEKPKLAAVVPIPLGFAVLLVQPSGTELLSAGVMIGLGIGGLAVAYGVELAQEGATSGKFELRRLARGAGIVAALVVALLVLSRVGFLFPDTSRDQVIPPRRPEPPPTEPDRVLFSVRSDRVFPIRLGTLDVYRDVAWLTPPFDTKRLIDVPPAGPIPPAPVVAGWPGDLSALETFEATFTVADMKGHVLPAAANPLAVRGGTGGGLDYDPRTQALRLTDERVRKGLQYTVVAPRAASADELKAAPPPRPTLAEFLQVPAPPSDVVALMTEAPKEPLFDRLQYVRNVYYQKVVAAGAGDPVDVPPRRVAEMLAGADATPYEITAGEVLLARWAGVPARIGYGYYGGDKAGDGVLEVRPKHGATWLEAYFEGHGWIPITGTPPKARSTLNQKPKKPDPTIKPSDELGLVLLVPVRLQSIQQIYEVARYWAIRVVPWAMLSLLTFAFYPGPLKWIRGVRRRRWAVSWGPRERIAVAYAELRDAANDYNFGDPVLTPLEFAEIVDDDAEHEELAWLMTRAMWGDLSRGITIDDAERAEEMSRSVTRRLKKANFGLARAAAIASRASLADPYSADMPNMWLRFRPLAAVRRRLAPIAKVIRHPLRARRRRMPAVVAVALVVVLVSSLLTGCARNPDLAGSASAEQVLPSPFVPDAALGGIAFRREEDAEAQFESVGDDALVGDSRVYTLHEGDVIQGSLQVGTFKPGLRDWSRQVRQGILGAIGGGNLTLTRLGSERVYTLTMPEQRVLLWFSPDDTYYEAFVTRRAFTAADSLFVSLLAFQRGEAVAVDDAVPVPPLDPLRGTGD
jgi:hypothetical protein